MKDKTGKILSKQELSRKVMKRMEAIMLEFCVYLLHCIGNVPSHHIRRFAYRLSGVKIGKDSTIHMQTVFYDPRHIFIGNDTIIGERATLDGRDNLIIGNHVDIASEVMLYNAQHKIHAEHFAAEEGVEKAPIVIGDYVFIGPRVIVLPGVTIGKGAIIGAGAVVTDNVEEFTIMGGIPARKIGERKNKDLHYRLGRAAWFR